MAILAALRRLTHGPAPALPRPLDAAAERWARLRPRVRLLLLCAAVLAFVALGELRIQSALARWGGTPVPVLVAEHDLAVGSSPGGVRRHSLPPAAVPPGALTAVPAGAVLAFALPAGNVLTASHLDDRGPAAALGAEARAVPIPVEDGWGLVAGGWVDVWVLGAADEPAVLVARSRPVLELREADRHGTALIGLEGDEVRAATTGLAVGQLLLTHAPAPNPGG
jgi:hypothetical protein